MPPCDAPTVPRDVGARPWLRIALAAALGLVLAVLVVPSFRGWHHADDVRNMRWVLEYRDVPWQALTQRHALHDHIRPLSLMLSWAGAQLSDGAWWGPHLVLCALVVGAILGLAAFVAVRSGSVEGGLLAGLLTTGLLATTRILSWNASVGTAAALCFGWWALAAAARAARTGRLAAVVVAGSLVILAGLAKEPGWVVYPVAAAALALEAWRRGHRKGAGALLGLVPLGLLGIAWSWHPANLLRTGAYRANLLERGLVNLEATLGWAVDLWPVRRPPVGADSEIVGGIVAPVVALGLAATVVGTGPGRRWWPIPALAAGLLGAWWAAPAAAAWLTLLVVAAVAVRRGRDLGPEFVVLGVTLLLVAPGQRPVPELGIDVGFALAGVLAIRLPRLGRVAPAVVLASAVLVTVAGFPTRALLQRLVHPASAQRDRSRIEGLESPVWVLQERDQIEALAVLTAAVGDPRVGALGRQGALELGPLYGIQPDLDADPSTASAEFGPGWMILAPAPALVAFLAAHDLPGGPRPDAGAGTVTLAPGRYVFGFTSEQPVGGLAMTLHGRCRKDWHADAIAPVPTHLALARVGDGCSPLDIRWRGRLPSDVRAWIVPVEPVSPSLRRAPAVPRILAVAPGAGLQEVVRDLEQPSRTYPR